MAKTLDITQPTTKIRVAQVRSDAYDPIYCYMDYQVRCYLSCTVETPEEIAAFKLLRKALRWERQRRFLYPYDSKPYRKTGIIDMSGYTCQLHPEIVRQFASWFAFTDPVEDLIRQAHADFINHKKEWQELRARKQFQSIYGFNDGSAALHLLGLDGTANPDDIKKQYRTLAKQHHPDVGGDVEQFKKISAAYRVLTQHL